MTLVFTGRDCDARAIGTGGEEQKSEGVRAD
jgi:hypothetical protein